MYCPSCGAESTLELNYCNRCGANLAGSVAPRTPFVPVSVTKPALVLGLTTTALTLGGFIVLIAGAIELARVFRDPDPIMAMLGLGITTILVSDILLIRLLSRVVTASLSAKPVIHLPKPEVK